LSSRVAILIASHSTNMGMYSVDLAAEAFFQELRVQFDFFQFGASRRRSYGRLRPIDYRSASQIANYDKVVLWGDFTSLPYYGRTDFTGQVSRAEYSWLKRFLTRRGIVNHNHKQTAYARWVQLFAEAPAMIEKSYSVGQNFQRLIPPPDGDPTEFAEAKRMLSHYSGICVRDSVSYANLNAMKFSTLHSPRLDSGMDVAFLLPSASAVPRALQKENRPTVGLFFKRSRLSNISKLVYALQAAGLRVVFINGWLRSLGDIDQNFSTALEQIRACDVILSDTYHFLINSHREGAAIVGVGRPSQVQLSTVSDYKKKVLFRDLDMAEAYFEIVDGVIDDNTSRILSAAVDKAIQERLKKTDETRQKIDRFRAHLKQFIN
jgi:hypothetical protein